MARLEVPALSSSLKLSYVLVAFALPPVCDQIFYDWVRAYYLFIGTSHMYFRSHIQSVVP